MDLTNPVVLVAVMGVVGTFIGFLGIVAGLIAAFPLQRAMAKKTSSEADSMDANTLTQTRTVYGQMLEDQQAQIKAQQAQMEQQAQRLSFVEAEQVGTVATSTKLVDSLNLNIVDLTKQVEGLTGEVVGLKDLMTNQQAESSKLVESLNLGMTGLQETVAEQGATITNLSGSLEKANGTIVELNKEVSGLKALVQGANETIASLKQLVSDLIEQIKGLGAVPVAAEPVTETAVVP